MQTRFLLGPAGSGKTYRCLAEIGVVGAAKPPQTRRKYLAVEQELIRFAKDIRVDFDELDLVLWSMKTGQILK